MSNVDSVLIFLPIVHEALMVDNVERVLYFKSRLVDCCDRSIFTYTIVMNDDHYCLDYIYLIPTNYVMHLCLYL